MNRHKIIQGDALAVLKTLENESVDCVVTSPPYWGLRDYGVEGQLGLEKTPEEYVAKMVEVFREVKRTLKKEGTCWLNLGDTYSAQRWTGNGKGQPMNKMRDGHRDLNPEKESGLPDKNLVGIPWRVAFALQADGWYLRQDIIWHKPNPMPESVTDRCTKSHEYVFLLTKSPKYYFDHFAIQEESIWATKDKRAITGPSKGGKAMSGQYAINKGGAFQKNGMRNKRSVWSINTGGFKEAHFATFPEALIEPMVLVGCPKEACKKCGKAREQIKERQTPSDWEFRKTKGAIGGSKDTGNKQQIGSGWSHDLSSADFKVTGMTDCGCGAGFTGGIVLDPFMGAGTTAVVAKKLNRQSMGIELNPDYIKIAEKRIADVPESLFKYL